MKKSLFVLIVILIASSVFAFNVENTLSVGVFVPECTEFAKDTFSFDFAISDSLFVGPYIGIGESIRYYKTESSKALLYGPVVELGLETGRLFGTFSFGLKGGVQAVYANFPTVLWFDAGLFGLYKLNDRLSLEFDSIILFWNKQLSCQLAFGARVGL